MPELKVREVYVKSPVPAGEPITGRLKFEISNVNKISSEPAKPFRLKVHVGATLSRGGIQRGDYDVVGDGEGTPDGTHEMPLEMLKTKAPDENCEVTLKLEVAFKDDPRNQALFPEQAFQVGEAVATGAKTRVWVLKGGRPQVNPEKQELTNQRDEPDRPATYSKRVSGLSEGRMVYSDSGTEYGKKWAWTVELTVPKPPPVVVPRGASFGLTLKAVMTQREWPREDWPAGAGLSLRAEGFDIKAPPGAETSEFAGSGSVFVGRDPLPGGTRVETSVERTFTLALTDSNAPDNTVNTPWLVTRIEVHGPMLLPWLRYEYECKELTEQEIKALQGGTN